VVFGPTARPIDLHSKPGEQPGQAVVIAPRAEQLLVLQGDLTKKRWIQHIQFSGLSFAQTNWTLPPTGNAAGKPPVFPGNLNLDQ
jgi:hypothetical protein